MKWDTRLAHSYETLDSAYLKNSKIYTATLLLRQSYNF